MCGGRRYTGGGGGGGLLGGGGAGAASSASGASASLEGSVPAGARKWLECLHRLTGGRATCSGGGSAPNQLPGGPDAPAPAGACCAAASAGTKATRTEAAGTKSRLLIGVIPFLREGHGDEGGCASVPSASRVQSKCRESLERGRTKINCSADPRALG